MTDEVGEQIRLPLPEEDTTESSSGTGSELRSNTIVPSVSTQTEKPKRLISLDEGTPLRSGPMGEARGGQHMGFAGPETKVTIRNTKIVDGITSHLVEFESPPEKKGQTAWITKRFKGKGFI